VIAGHGIRKEVIAGRHSSARSGCVLVCQALRTAARHHQPREGRALQTVQSGDAVGLLDARQIEGSQRGLDPTHGLHEELDGGFGHGISDRCNNLRATFDGRGAAISVTAPMRSLLQKLWSIVKVQRFFERRPRLRIVTGDYLSARLPDYLVQLPNGAHRVNGRGQKTWLPNISEYYYPKTG
jgi:hypothetical protein